MSAFEASQPLGVFDDFRVPYVVPPDDDQRTSALAAGFAWAHSAADVGGSRYMYWLPADRDRPRDVAPTPTRPHCIGDIPIFGRVLPDDVVRPRLQALGGVWRRLAAIESSVGGAEASVWSDDQGSLLLPFDPDEIVRNFRSERYLGITEQSSLARLIALGRAAYYRVRPLLPRSLQIAMRRAFTRVQDRASFPRWPTEPALHDFCELILRLFAGVAGCRVPWIAPWPSGFESALVLTHDVETAAGVRDLTLLRDAELAAGYRSSWNFVPERYRTDDAIVRNLLADGFEVGVHGLRHDGSDLGSRRKLEERLPAMRGYAERWSASGFRSPATQRVYEWMPLLGFDYDSSYPDTDRYEPQAGGCCSWLPFFNEDLVELPITLPQDHTLFVILRRSDEKTWVEKAEFLRRRGGMALLITHPDYMTGPALLAAYARFLAHFAGDETVWKALPREVAAWWRRRAATELRPAATGWTAVGPAADEATIRYVEPPSAVDPVRRSLAEVAT
jgi:hypothetical protein